MTAEALWHLFLEGIGVLVAILTFLVPYLDSQRKKHQAALKVVTDALADRLKEVKDAHERDVAEFKAALIAERADRVEKTARTHARIDQIQTELIGEMRADLSEIKGELKGVSNIMTVVQQWFVNQNNLGKTG